MNEDNLNQPVEPRPSTYTPSPLSPNTESAPTSPPSVLLTGRLDQEPSNLSPLAGESLDGQEADQKDVPATTMEWHPPKASRRARFMAASRGIGVQLAMLLLLISMGVGGIWAVVAVKNRQQTPQVNTQSAPTVKAVTVSRPDWVLTVNGEMQVAGLSKLTDLKVANSAVFEGTITATGNATFSQDVSANTVRANRLVIGGNAVVLSDLQAMSFTGDGSGLSNVDAQTLAGNSLGYFEDASHLLSGTLSDERLSTNIARLHLTNLFSETNIFSQDLQVQGNLFGTTATYSGNVSADSFTQNGYQVCDASGNCTTGGGGSGDAFVQGGNAFAASAVLGTNDGYDLILRTSGTNRLVIAANGAVSIIGALTANSFSGNGNGLSSLNATSLTSGTVDDGRLSPNVVLKDGTNLMTGVNNFSNSSNSFTGNGSGLSGVNADQLNGHAGSYYQDAGNIASGTLDNLRLSTSVTLQGNVFNGANQLVRLTADGALPALDGANVSNVNAVALQGYAASYFTNADNITSGTLADSRLSTNVPLLQVDNVFVGNNSFATLSATAILQNGNAVCDVSGNCAGVGGGVTTGGGSAGTLALFTDTGKIGDSIVSQASTVITVAGTLNATYLQGEGSAITNLSGSSITSGIVGVGVGGTGVTNFTTHGIVYGNGSGALGVTSAGATGQCLVGSSGAAPVWADCSSVSGGATPGGVAGGDLSGTYPNPTVAGLQGTPLAIASLTGGDFLLFDGTNWINAGLSGDITATTNGVVTIGNGTVTNAKLASSALTVTAGTGLAGGGAVSLGSSTSLSVLYGAVAGTAAQGSTSLSFSGSGNLTGSVSGSAGGGFTTNTLAVVSNPTFSGLVTADGGLMATNLGFTGTLTQTGTGVITLGSLSTGIVQSSSSGVISSGAIDRNSSLLSGQTSIANGGTGATSATAARSNLGAASSGLNADITSLSGVTSIANASADLTIGHTGQALILQGNSSSSFRATSGGFTTVLGFAVPAANVTFNLPAVAGGSYDVCTTAGNCSYASSSGSGSYIQNQYGGAQSANLWISGTAQVASLISSTVNATGALQTAGVNRVTGAGELVNVTADAGILTSGTLDNARLSTAVAIDRGTIADGTDFDSLTTQGTYRLAGGTYSNFPSGVHTFGTLVVSTSGSSVTQTYYTHANGVTGNWTRTKWNATDWNVWAQLWSSANDGTGTGLDADFLDGHDTVYFTNADNLTSGTVLSARLSGDYTGITAVGTLSSLSTSGVITSSVATGTAPFTVASTTKVANLNADLLDGLDSTAFGDATAANQTTILNRIGTNADASGTTTLFARLASIDATKIGASGDTASGTGSIFARLAYLVNSIGGTGDAASATGSVNAKLAYLISNAGSSSSQSQKFAEFTTSTTWTAPAGVTSVEVFMVGGGAGGGYALYSGGGYWSCALGGGGGGGGIIKKTITVVPGTTYNIVIGAGGTGANCAVSTGANNGGATTFAGLSAPGGTAATYNLGGTAGAGGGDGGNANFYTSGSPMYQFPATQGMPGVEGYGSGGGGATAITPSSSSTYAPGMPGGPGAGRGGTTTSSGSTFAGTAGVANRGGGGGGGTGSGSSGAGGAGGSGYMYLKWVE